MNEEAVSVHDYIDIVYRKKWLIVVVFLCVFLTTLFFVRRQPDRFTSSATLYLEYTPQGAAPFIPTGISIAATPVASAMGKARPLEFYLGIFDSRSFRNNVYRDLARYSMDLGMDRTEAAGRAREALRTLSVTPARHDGYYTVSVEASSPHIAFAADSIATYLFLDRCKEFARHETSTMEEFIDVTFDSSRVALARAENALQTFRERHALLELRKEEANPGLPLEYVRLLEGFYDTRRERQEAQAALAATTQAAELIEQNYDSLALDQVLRAVPAKDLAEVRDRVRRARMELQIAEFQERDFKRQLEEYERSHPELPTISLTYFRLVRERDIYENLTNQLLERREELRVQAASESGGVRVIDEPMPGTAMPSRTRVMLVIGVVIGIVFGVGVAFFWEFMDPNIKTTAEISKVLGVTAIGTIPSISGARWRRSDGRPTSGRRGVLVSETNPKDPVAEAYRALRTSLTYSIGDHRLRSFVISSSGQSEGKSITTANLAITCAQMGQRTVIVDGDLRRPVQHILFKLERDGGLTEYLLQDLPLADVAKPSGVERLDVITSGITPPNPAPLLASQGMRDRLEELKSKYDLIIIDSPPVIPVTDAVILGKITDGVLMVVRCATSPRATGKHAVAILSNAKVPLLGAVLNDIDVTRHYGGYYYYNYYYHYYYGGYYGSGSEDGGERTKRETTR